jgi:hypothetical protein
LVAQVVSQRGSRPGNLVDNQVANRLGIQVEALRDNR